MSKRIAIIAVILILAVSVIFYFARGGSKAKRKKIPAALEQKAKPRSLTPEIAKVVINPPDPTSVDFLQADPVLKDKRMTYVTYSYRWFVNGEAVRGLNQSGLPTTYFKRGDDVYCQVKAKRSIYQSEEVESKKIEIENAKPIINPSPMEPFQAPGIFRFTIDARDPDGDSLRYRLLSPLEKGIKIDPNTGQIEWYINWSPPIAENDENSVSTGSQGNAEGAGVDQVKQKDELDDDASPIVNIAFEVKDSEGAVAVGSITLNLNEGKQVYK